MTFSAILAAAKENDVDAITEMIAAGMSVNSTNQIGQGGLHVAAIWGSTGAVKVLLSGNANPNVQNQFGVTPLHYAAQNSKYDTARLLIENGAKTDIQAQNGCCAYEMAKEDEMRALCGGPTLAMHRCIRERDLAGVQALISDGYNLSEKDRDGNNVLHSAIVCALGDAEGAASSSASASSSSPTAAAAQAGDGLALAAAVLAAAAGGGSASLATAQQMHSAAGMLPLHLACAAGHAGLAGALLSAGAPVNAKTRLRGHMFNGDWSRKASDGTLTELTAEDKTPLHLALDHLETQEEDEDSDGEDEEEVVAAGGGGGGGGGLALVKLLLAQKADVNAADKDMGTALHQAVGEGMHEVAALLLARRADPRLGCKAIGMENSCLHQAVLKGDARMVALLLETPAGAGAGTGAGAGAGAPRLDVDAPGRDGWTPLCLAARSGCVPVAKALLDAGASPSVAMASSGKTAAEIAAVNKKPAMVALLEKAVAAQ